MRWAGDDDMLVLDGADVARVGVFVCCGVREVQPDEGRHGHHLGPGRGRGTARAGEGGERGQTGGMVASEGRPWVETGQLIWVHAGGFVGVKVMGTQPYEMVASEGRPWVQTGQAGEREGHGVRARPRGCFIRRLI